MNKKNINLIAGILAFLVFIGFMGESGPTFFFDYAVNIWIMRLAWLILSISFYMNYRKLKREAAE